MERMISIFVGNLPWSVTEQQLKQKFEEIGDVQAARIITDKMTGRSRGFGFIEMKESDAQEAIKSLNGFDWSGRQIVVNEARPRTERQ